jgi:hypothetical protein
MEQRREMLSSHAVVITEEGSWEFSLEMREETSSTNTLAKERMSSLFKIFTESQARDVVFAVGRAVDGPIELCFHAWELDRFGDRVIIPYHVRLCIRGDVTSIFVWTRSHWRSRTRQVEHPIKMLGSTSSIWRDWSYKDILDVWLLFFGGPRPI